MPNIEKYASFGYQNEGDCFIKKICNGINCAEIIVEDRKMNVYFNSDVFIDTVYLSIEDALKYYEVFDKVKKEYENLVQENLIEKE